MIALGLLGLIQTAFAGFCIIDIVQRPAVLGGRKWLWIVIVVLFSLPGALAYLAIGRVAAPHCWENDEPSPQARSRTEATADLLYPAATEAAAAGEGWSEDGERRSEAGDGRPPAVSIAGLTKSYGGAHAGRTWALAGVDLRVPEGSVFGFLGPNGAGKTTTLRILAGLARASGGDARVFGHDVAADADAVHDLLGYLPDVPGFYGWMTAEQYLDLSAQLFGLPADVRRRRIEGLLALAGLGGVSTRIDGYSRGMKQRLGIAQALVNAPRLLLLDEPTSALDPIGRREVLDMIAALAGRTTVLFSTHILADAERVCDTVAVVSAGRVVEQAGIDELKRRHGGAHRVTLEVDDAGSLATALRSEPWVRSVARSGNDLRVEVLDPSAAHRRTPAIVAEHGLALRRYETEEASLEDVFVDLIRGGQEGARAPDVHAPAGSRRPADGSAR